MLDTKASFAQKTTWQKVQHLKYLQKLQCKELRNAY